MLKLTLRTENKFNSIFKCRLFLTDLVSELNVVQSYSSKIIHYPYITYRGQSMLTEEIERLKSAVGDSIFLKQFLSTSLNRDIARMFAESSLSTPFTQNVLLTIEIDSSDVKNGISRNSVLYQMKRKFYF